MTGKKDGEMVSKTMNNVQIGDVVRVGGGNWLKVEAIEPADNARQIVLVGKHAEGRQDTMRYTRTKNVKADIR